MFSYVNNRFKACILGVCVFLVGVVLVFLLRKVFVGQWVLPQAFSIGSLSIHYYGITMALAVGAGWWLAFRRASRYGFTSSQADSLFQWLVVCGFVGARLYHVASSWQYYWQYPLDMFKVWHGGLSIFGALLGGFLVLIFYTIALSRKNRGRGFYRTLLHTTDWLIPSVVLGQIIGRFGNFFNYEAFGYPTNVPWKMFVPVAFRPEGMAGQAFYQPLFLYEAIGNVIILFGLLWLSKRSLPIYQHTPVILGRVRETRGSRAGQKMDSGLPSADLVETGMTEKVMYRHAAATTPLPGTLFFTYLLLYNTLRFVIEFWRVDSTFLWGFIRLNTVSSGVLCMVGIVGLLLQFVYAQKPGHNME